MSMHPLGPRTGIGRFAYRTVGVMAVLGLMFGACGDGDDTGADPTRQDDPAVTESPAGAGAGETPGEIIEGTATLTEEGGSGVSGEANLSWNSKTQVLTVDVRVEGTEEGTSYLSILGSACPPPQSRIHQLGSFTGGDDGTGQLNAEVAGVESVDLDGGWTMVIAVPQAGPQACGVVEPA